jgi:hypothetical protein
VLPRMLEKIEADLATAGPAKARRFRQRAELIRELLMPDQCGRISHTDRLPSGRK